MYCEENFKRMSSFYVNEVHLITMLLPYMERKIHEDCEIYTVLQNSLDKIIKLLLSKLNLKEELKEKIKEIDWNAKTMNDYKNLEKQINNSSKKYIIINRNEKYVREINKMLNKYKKNHKDADLVLINCYDIIEFNKNIGSILENTDKILNTSGEHEIEEIFPEYVREVKKKA